MNNEYKMNILKLAADGSNWVTYRDCMKYALDMCGWSDHLTDTTVTQAYKDAGDVGGLKPEARSKVDEAAVRQLIVASVPNSVFNRIKGGADAKVNEEPIDRPGEEALEHKLAAMGQTISDEQYTNTLLGSLPSSYNANVNIITTNADMSSTTITPATVIRIIMDEYDKRVLRKAKLKSSQVEVLRSFRDAKGGRKEGQGPRNKAGVKDGAAAATEQGGDIEAWAIIEAVDEECTAEVPQSPHKMAKEKPGVTATEAELYDSGASRH
ncbi:hypothetical protein EDB84DRAFT_1571049 [Lactarius hengduanensis]|nr:hypothetical protein EDB84DRAFT_1571049 [Lactarius hengduanensis]